MSSFDLISSMGPLNYSPFSIPYPPLPLPLHCAGKCNTGNSHKIQQYRKNQQIQYTVAIIKSSFTYLFNVSSTSFVLRKINNSNRHKFLMHAIFSNQEIPITTRVDKGPVKIKALRIYRLNMWERSRNGENSSVSFCYILQVLTFEVNVLKTLQFVCIHFLVVRICEMLGEYNQENHHAKHCKLYLS